MVAIESFDDRRRMPTGRPLLGQSRSDHLAVSTGNATGRSWKDWTRVTVGNPDLITARNPDLITEEAGVAVRARINTFE